MAAARKEDRDPERRCIATGAVGPCARLIRFVVSPDGEIVPDVAEKLPGRGLWVSAEKEAMARAARGNLFAKAAKRPVRVGDDLAERVAERLRARMAADLGLARKAGLLVLGFEKILQAMDGKQPPRLLVEASDGGADGRRKLLAAASVRNLQLTLIDCLCAEEMRLALGRENVIHAAAKPGTLADRLIRDDARLSALRGLKVDQEAGSVPVANERDA